MQTGQSVISYNSERIFIWHEDTEVKREYLVEKAWMEYVRSYDSTAVNLMVQIELSSFIDPIFLTGLVRLLIATQRLI